MARKYTIPSGKVACPAVTVVKVMCSLATGATDTCVITGIDVTFDGVPTGTTTSAIPALIELCRTTAAPSAGAAQTPVAWRKGANASVTTGRINDTTDGTGPTVIKSWLVSVSAGLLQQLPLGREFEVDNSDFWEVRITPQTGMTACNYACNLDFEE